MATQEQIQQRAELLCRVMSSVSSASVALAWWADEGPLRIEVLSSRVRQMLATEYIDLDGRHLTHAVERFGMLRAPRSGRVLALTTALVLPRRLPRAVRIATGVFDGEDDRETPQATGVPLGEALAAHHVETERRQAIARTIFGTLDASGEPLVVRCQAVLTVEGRPAALVREEVTMTLLQQCPPAELVDAFPGEPSPALCP